jgi:hypothetical protein
MERLPSVDWELRHAWTRAKVTRAAMRIRVTGERLMHQLQIIDPEGFHAVLQRVLDRFKTHLAAANALGLKQSTFTRLLNQTGRAPFRRAVRRGIYDQIEAGIRTHFGPHQGGRELQTQLRASLITGLGELVRQHYVKWQEAEYRRLKPMSKLAATLWKDPDYRNEFQIFLKRTTGETVKPPWKRSNLRLLLSILRALEPLGAAEATWGVERSWRELRHKKQLKAFLRAALNKERLLLRPTDTYLARFNKLAPPEDFYDGLPIPEDPDRRPAEEVFAADVSRV